MDLKLACADFTFPLLDHDSVLSLIAMMDFKGVDIGLFHNRSHIEPDDVLADIPNWAKGLRSKVRDRGLEFADIFIQPGIGFEGLAVNHPDVEVRKKSRHVFEQFVDFTVRCEARHMTCLPGIVWEGETAESSMSRCADELSWRLDRAKAAGVTLSTEAHRGSVAPTPQAAMDLVKRTPGLTLTLDYTHFTYDGTPDSEIEPLIAHASHFHARGGREKRLQAPMKDNSIDYAAILAEMNRTNYGGYVGVEYVWIDWEHCNEVDNVSESILMRDHLRNAFAS